MMRPTAPWKLDFDGAPHRIDDALKLEEKPIAGGPDDAAVVLGDLRVAQFAADCLSAARVPSLSAPVSRE